jgi:peptide/nickel transport system substrate-binding protein
MRAAVKRTLSSALAAVVLAAGTGAPGAAKNATTIPHVLRIGDTQDFDSLNPHLATAITLGNLSSLTMAYLVRYGHDNRPTPELATEVPTQKNGGISKDGRTIVWHLRRGVKWSDGEPFDADDVVWSTGAVNNPANNEVGRDGWELITKIDEPDKYTVAFHLSKPYSAYLPTFFGSAGANPCILPKHLLAALPNINTAPYNSKPVGIGPFRYTEWVRGDHVTLEANPYYWRGRPKLQKIVYKIVPDRNTLLTQLQTGEVDVWAYVPPAFAERAIALPTVAHIRHPGMVYQHVDFNTTHPALADRSVRAALRLALDRETMMKKISHGVGILQETQVSQANPFYTAPPPMVPFDVGKANALLDRAGWKLGPDGVRAKNGVRLDLDFGTISGSQDADSRIELIRSTWKQIGVSLDVKHYNSALFFAVTGGIVYGGKFDVVAFGWQLSPTGAINSQNSCDLIPPHGQNVTRLCDRRLQHLLDEQSVTYDEDKRKALLAQELRIIDEEVPYVVLYVQEDVHAFNKDLTGWNPNTSTPFDDFLNVDI